MTNPNRFAAIICSISLLAIAGCATPSPSKANPGGGGGAPPPANQVCSNGSNDIATAITALTKGLTADLADPTGKQAAGVDEFDDMLDCFVGPIDHNDIEQRLLRGHVVLTLLAMYGAYNVHIHNGVANIQDDAALILKSIESAELALSKASKNVAADAVNPFPVSTTPSFDKVTRIVDVLQVAIYDERPTITALRGTILNIVAVAGGGVGSLKDLLNSALTAVKKAATLALYGGALRIDTFKFLTDVKANPPTKSADWVAKWSAWDKLMFDACASLAQAAGPTTTNQCIPSAAVLKASFEPTGTVPTR